MNNDLISREYLEDAFDNLCCHNCKTCRNFRIEDSFYKCALIDNAPTVERPQGEWESVGFVNMKYAWFRCSNCHKTTRIYMDSNNDFCCIADIRKKAIACLYCGADMRGEENEDYMH